MGTILFKWSQYWEEKELEMTLYYCICAWNSEKEYQANEFAAAFLMPKKEYFRVMNENLDGNKVMTSKIAEHFHVSVEAASNRGKFLGYLKW